MAVSPLDPGIERALRVPDLDGKMAGKKAVELSPESVARANRHRLTLEEGARTLLTPSPIKHEIIKKLLHSGGMRAGASAISIKEGLHPLSQHQPPPHDRRAAGDGDGDDPRSRERLITAAGL